MIFFKKKYFCKYAFIFLFFLTPSIMVSETCYRSANEIYCFGDSVNNFGTGGGKIHDYSFGVGKWDFSCGSRRIVEKECFTDRVESSCKMLRVCVKYPKDNSW
tara:strand:+ start:97 stop:405 length:309 start_codon:yes stop_codon:yes gene_type:complete